MAYQEIFDVAAGIAEKLHATSKFRKVLLSSATNTGQIYDHLEAMASLPCALVCLGNIDYDDNNLVRTLRPIIVIADEFRRGSDRRAEGIWSLLDLTERLFLPKVNSEGADYPEVLGIEFNLVGTTPVENDSAKISAYALTLQGREFMKQ